MTELQRAVEWLESQVSDEVSFDGEPDGCERAYLEHIQNCRALLDALRWVPVSERLPESGEHVLLCCEVRPSKNRYVCDGYYAAPKTLIGGNNEDCATEYDEEKDEYFLVDGFYEVIKNWDEYTSITIEDFVTHWRPLPPKPKEG